MRSFKVASRVLVGVDLNSTYCYLLAPEDQCDGETWAVHFVTSEAKLGIVGEVGAELEKQWAEVLVDAIEVKVIDHGRRADKPGVSLPGLGVGASLGTQDRCLLLDLADKEDALGALELSPVLQSDVLFALSLGESNQRDLILLDEALDCSDEPLDSSGP